MQHTTIKICLTAALLLFSTNLYELSAENGRSQEPQQKVEKPKEDANKLLIDSLKKEIARVNGEIKKANGELNAAKKNYEKSAKSVRENLIKCGLDANTANSLDIKELESISTQKNQQAKQQEVKIAELKIKREEAIKATQLLNDQIKELTVIRDSIVKVTIAKYEPLVEKPFSQIEPLATVIKECKQFDDDAKMVEFIAKLNTLYEHQTAYNEGLRLLNLGYDNAKVQESIGNITKIITLVKESQRGELQEILDKLNIYREGVLTLIEFIEGLNKEKGEYFKFEDFCRYKAKMMRENNERTNKWRERYEQFIAPIPYLKKSFESFEQEIQKAPQSHPIIELAILRHKKE